MIRSRSSLPATLVVLLSLAHPASALEARPASIPPALSLLGHPVEYVVITDDALKVAFQPLAEWKTQTGVPAVVQGLSAILGQYPAAADDAERIRLFIRNAHQYWGTRWVLLGGDTGIIPVRYAWTAFYGGWFIPTDLYFQCLDGNWNADGDALWGEGYQSSSAPGDSADLVPEIWIGRAPVTTTAEVDRFVAKTLQYEKTPVGDYEQGMLCAAEVLFPSSWTPGQPTTLDGAEMVETLLPTLDLRPELHVARLYENDTDPRWRPGALHESRQAVLDSLSRGYNLALLVGNGSATAISTGDALIVNADLSALANGPRLTNLYCMTGQANAIDSTSIGESALRAAGGAVSCIGASTFEFPTASRAYMQEFYRLALQDGVTAIGEAHGRSKAPFVPFSGFDSVNRWTQMSGLLLADPELRLWIGQPCALTVHRPATIDFGVTAFTVTVERSGAPIAGARVTAYRAGSQLSIAITDAAGAARVPFLGDFPGDFLLTVVAPGCRPDQGTIHVNEPATAIHAALVSAESDPDEVRLVWSCAECAGARAMVWRREPEGDPSMIREAAVDGVGRFAFNDRDVAPGQRFGYRLLLQQGAMEARTAEVWVDVPARVRFGLEMAGPHPGPGMPPFLITLPDARPARLELLDVGGRRIRVHEVGPLGAGTHRVRFEGGDRVPAGLYLVRLTRAGATQVRRVAVIR